MSFLPHLQSVVSQVEGALACSVMGFDGIAVESHQVPEAQGLDLVPSWVEYANVLGQLKGAIDPQKEGSIREMTLSSEKSSTLIRVVTTDYFLVLTMRPEGNFGKGRYALRIAGPKIQAEL